MSRLLGASVLVLALLVSGCATAPRPPVEPNPLVEDNRPAPCGGPGAWLDEHPVLETATFGLAVIGGLAVAGLVVVAVEAAQYHGGGWNWGP
jgi:hypothetical protein